MDDGKPDDLLVSRAEYEWMKAEIGHLRRERAEARAASSPHIDPHARHVPDLGRVRSAHSRMTAGMLSVATPHLGYCRDEREACYLCTLLLEIDALRAMLEKYLERHDNPCIDVHFVEGDLDGEARALLARLGGGGEPKGGVS